MELWDTKKKKKIGSNEPQASVSTAFSSSLKLSDECFFNSMDVIDVNSLCSRHHYVCSSVFPSSYRNTYIN